MTPESLVATVREKLQTLMDHYADRGRMFGYAFLVHQRWSGGPPVFGIITIRGESLTLSRSLLDSLGGVDCWIYGVVPARLELVPFTTAPGPSEIGPLAWASWAVPAVLILRPGRRRTRTQQTLPWPPEGVMTPDLLARPMVFLTRARPAGWPN